MTLTIREPGSALTHFFTMMAAFPAATILLVKASASSRTSLLAMSVFMLSIVLLYGASALYHTLTVSAGILRIFQKIDHMMIFVLIAGSYTPFSPMILLRLGSVLLFSYFSTGLSQHTIFSFAFANCFFI